MYLLVVRPLLMKKEQGGRVYADRWPARLDLEDRVYRPLLLKVLPGLCTLVCRLVADLPEWLALSLRHTFFRKRLSPVVVPVGNRMTFAFGRCWNACAARLNGTLCKAHPLRTDMEYAAGDLWDRLRDKGVNMTRSVSYGLLMMAVGLLITCVYLLIAG